jgi:hypothetical protein
VNLASGFNLPNALMIFCAIAATYGFGSLVWGIAKQQKNRGVPLEELFRAAAEKRREAKEQWRVPPELNAPPPRRIKSAPLGIRLLWALPRLVFLVLLTAISYMVGFLYSRTAPVQMPQGLMSFAFHGLADFLGHPQAQVWMLWPSLAVAAIAGLTELPRRRLRREERRLLACGIPACGAVIVFHRSWIADYADADGSRIRGSSLSAPPHGDEAVITVLYDPETPDRFIRYPVARYRIVVDGQI